jgi:hypothetical protein
MKRFAHHLQSKSTCFFAMACLVTTVFAPIFPGRCANLAQKTRTLRSTALRYDIKDLQVRLRSHPPRKSNGMSPR